MARETPGSRNVVGLAGFEPTTSSSRTKRATKLRYSPLSSLRRQQYCPEGVGSMGAM